MDESSSSEDETPPTAPKSNSLRSRKKGLSIDVVKSLVEDIEEAGGFTRDSNREPRFKLARIINKKRDLYGKTERQKRQVENKVQKLRALPIDKYEEFVRSLGIRGHDSPSSQSSSSSQSSESSDSIAASTFSKESSLPRSSVKSKAGEMSSFRHGSITEIEVDVLDSRWYPENIWGVATSLVHVRTDKKGVAKAFDVRLPVLDPNDIATYKGLLAGDGMSLRLTLPSLPSYTYRDAKAMFAVEAEDKNVYSEEVKTMAEAFAARMHNNAALQTKTVELNLSQKCRVFDHRFGLMDGQSKVHGYELTPHTYVLSSSIGGMPWTFIYLFFRVQLEDSFEETSTSVQKDPRDNLMMQLARASLGTKTTTQDLKRKQNTRKQAQKSDTGAPQSDADERKPPPKSDADERKPPPKSDADLIEDEATDTSFCRSSFESVGDLDSQKEEQLLETDLIQKRKRSLRLLIMKVQDAVCTEQKQEEELKQLEHRIEEKEREAQSFVSDSFENENKLHIRSTHLYDLMEKQHALQVKTAQNKVKLQHLDTEIVQMKEKVALLERETIDSERDWRNRDARLRELQEKHQALQSKNARSNERLQHLDKQLIQTQEKISLLEDSTKSNDRKYHDQGKHLLKLTEEEHVLQIKDVQSKGQLQSLNEQLFQKQETIFQLEDSTKSNEQEYQAQRNHLLKLTAEERELQIKDAQGKDRLQNVNEQLFQKQEIIFRLEGSTKSNEQEYQAQRNHLLKLTAEERELQIKDAQGKDRLQNVNEQLFTIFQLEDSTKSNEQEYQVQKNHLLELTEEESALQIKDAQGKGWLQHLNEQLSQKQETIFQLEDSAKLNEHKYHAQCNRLLELTEEERELRIKDAQEKGWLRNLSEQLSQKQETIFQLEDSAHLNEQVYHARQNHLLELAEKESALQIKDTQLTKILQQRHSENMGMLVDDEVIEDPNCEYSSDPSVDILSKKADYEKVSITKREPQAPVKLKTKAKTQLARRQDFKYEAANGAPPMRPFPFPKRNPGAYFDQID